MATSLIRPVDDDDHLWAHQFIREHGRRPSDRELAQYRAAQSRAHHGLRWWVRRRAAALINRL